jgi:putative ABC transport system permease protein
VPDADPTGPVDPDGKMIPMDPLAAGFSAALSSVRLAARLAWREMRGGATGFGVFLACLALGVAATASVLSLSRSVMDGLAAEAQNILGADLEVSLSSRPADPALIALLASKGTLSQSVEARVMAATPQIKAPAAAGNPLRPQAALAALAAVDAAYPLYGALRLSPAMPLSQALGWADGEYGAVAEQSLLDRLGLRLGETVRVGTASFRLRATVASEPARASGLFSFGPRLLIGRTAFTATGLAAPGSLARYVYKLRLPAGQSAGAAEGLKEELLRRFPDEGATVRDANEAAPGLAALLDRLTNFLSLAGLSAMLTGGLGAALAVRAHLRGRADSIAALKCLGAPGRVVFLTYFFQTIAMALAATLIGTALGAAAPYALADLLGQVLPARPIPGIFAGPLALAAALGLLTAVTFCLWPLGQIRSVPGLALFRDQVEPPRGSPSALVLVLLGVCAAALACTCLAVAGNEKIGLGFLGAAAAASAVFGLISRAIVAVARRWPAPKNPAWRHALAGLHRPGNATAQVVFALGLGLTALATTALLQAQFENRLGDQIPAAAPSYFFLDIRKDQIDAFNALTQSVPELTKLETAPMLRGRITRIKQTPAEDARVSPDAAWVLRSDRGLTFSGPMPPGTKLTAGTWWPGDYHGPPLVSVDEDIAKGLGIGPGDNLTVNILGREVVLRVANLRAVKWLSLGINYVLVLSPGVLENAPYSYLATASFAGGPDRPAAEEKLFAAVTHDMPGVTAIPVGEQLDRVLAIGDTIAKAAKAASLLSLIAGTLTLAQAFRAGMREKIYESVIFKVCGATRRDIVRIMLPEYLLLGLTAGTGALLLGTVAAWLFTEHFLEGGFALLPLPAVLAVAAGGGLTTAFGLLGVRRALGKAAWTYLRNE